jgi:predicted AAA+ superfamily ATPase
MQVEPMLERYLTTQILSDLQEKMVFIGGPRQVGKTTLARELGKNSFPQNEYLNWDIDRHQKQILRLNFSPESDLVIFDEIHKYKNWKNHLKGIYDTQQRFKILITGSARLDLYRKGGDSMMGRYHYHRLHPLSLAEVAGYGRKFDIDYFEKGYQLKFYPAEKTILDDLIKFGSFPEPFLKKNQRSTRRWQRERKSALIREDIRDLELIREVSLFQILVNLLPQRVCSVLSLNSLRKDLSVAQQTVAKWMDILENFYYCFRLYPFQSTLIKSLKKEPKLFLWDYSEVSDLAARFENLIAAHLLKFTHYLADSYGLATELRYLRDIDGREVDFLLTIENRPVIAVEVKLSQQKPSTSLKYFARKLKIPYIYQVVMTEDVDFQSLNQNIRVISASKFLSGLV